MRAARALAAIAVLAAIPLAAAESRADSRYRDRVSADSFGNLVIYSAAGYKRIVVGEGQLARELADFVGQAPAAAHAPAAAPVVVLRECPAVLLKGRSYMYGLPDHVVPQPALDYCD